MSHRNKMSLIGQVEAALKECALRGIGTSKHDDKKAQRAAGNKDITSKKIYSWETYRSYLKQACYFVRYCKEQHRCKTIADCRQYVNEWLQKAIDDRKSAHTIKLYASSLAKLYGCSTNDFIKTPARQRANITRSRGDKVRDHHFSQKNNSNLIRFCKSTGLRRRELTALTGNKLVFRAGRPFIHVTNGKGGRERFAPIIGDIDFVIGVMEAAGDGKVFEHVPTAADIHGYRGEYATAMYKLYARPLDTLTKEQKYYFRGDLKGVVADRKAMMIVSEALGHNRINIIAGHYIRVETL